MRRLVRIATSLAVVTTVYWVYALIAVPLIEPRAHAKVTEKATDEAIKIARESGSRWQKEFGAYFPPGSWELQNPKVLESDQAKLLIKDYKNLPDGRVELRPCSMIFTPKEAAGAAPGQAKKPPIILEAPEGAILQFDEPFDLKRAKIGKLVRGDLIGPIVIRSGPTRPGADDELRVVTRDVQLTEEKIWTPHMVEFRLGPNQGVGRELEIQLTPQNTDGPTKKNGIGGLKSLQLTHDVKVRVQLGGASLLPGDKKAPQAETRGPKPPEPPVEVTCQGPFLFDLTKNTATFSEQVDVLRLNPIGPSDQMNCELLIIHFARRDPKVDAVTGEKSSEPSTALEARMIEARGDPVVIRAPSQGGHARCQHLEYEIKTGRITLEGSREVLLHQGSNEIRTRRLEYEPGEKGKMGRVFAVGPGWLQGALPEDPSQRYQAQWAKELRVNPDQQNQLITLLGTANMQFTGMGTLMAEEIYVWLLEAPRPVKSLAGRARVQTVGFGKQKSTSGIQPQRMLAVNNVRIDAPQLTGAARRLEVWFDPATSASQDPAASAAGASSVYAPASPATATAAAGGAKKPIAQRFDVGGALLRIQVRGATSEVSDVVVEGNARFAETKTAQPNVKPLLVRGDRLHVAQADTPQTQVTVAGKTAYFEARGLSLSGGKIHMQRDTNRVWIDGPGRMTLPIDKGMDGRAIAQKQTLDVTWQGSMNFDGRTVTYDRAVVARSSQQYLRTERLEVSLKRTVDLSNPSSPDQAGQPIEIDQVICKGGLFCESKEFDERGQQTSINQLQAKNATINNTTGAIFAEGPGWVTTVRSGGDKSLNRNPSGTSGAGSAGTGAGAGGTGVSGGATTGTPLPPGEGRERASSTPADSAKKADAKNADGKPAPGFTYLNVTFERDITGNLHRREATFANQVKAIYGPVTGWEQKIDPDKAEGLGPDDVQLSCDQLSVRDMPTPVKQLRGTMELETLGNTRVDGANYSARCHRLTYVEVKDLLILEGNGRQDAELYRQQKVGGETSSLAARRIMFTPSTNVVKVDDARFLNAPLIGNFGKEKKPAGK